VILFVPFIIYEDITIIQNEEPINRVFFAMVKNNCALRVIGGMDCGLNVGGRGVVIGVAECVLSFFFFFGVCVCVPSPVQTCDIPLGEVSFTALQCGLNTNS